MTQISIAVIGSCNIDVVVEAPKRPLAKPFWAAALLLHRAARGQTRQLPQQGSAPKFIWLAASATTITTVP